ncbi:MAG: energy-coupling factor transporter transmembrane protein EcfT [Firmicutes bacterium]|nr:energy-coupling factor transporter transmembrane protein EcfT [Bacillota bacterium]
MLKDITLGQYVPGRSPVHRTDARVKLLLGMALAVSVFLVDGWPGYGVMAAYVLAAAALSGLPLSYVLRGIRPVAFLVVLTVVLHVLFTPGTPLWRLGPVQVSAEGLDTALRLAVRLILLAAGLSIITLTTSPVAMTDALEWLLGPGRRLGVPAHEIAMMTTIALRFIPTLAEELDRIIKAQMARGADFETGGPLRRARALVPVLVPLFLSAFRRADELSVAMESRCYRGAEGRTRWRSAGRFDARDWAVLVASLLVMIGAGWAWR